MQQASSICASGCQSLYSCHQTEPFIGVFYRDFGLENCTKTQVVHVFLSIINSLVRRVDIWSFTFSPTIPLYLKLFLTALHSSPSPSIRHLSRRWLFIPFLHFCQSFSVSLLVFVPLLAILFLSLQLSFCFGPTASEKGKRGRTVLFYFPSAATSVWSPDTERHSQTHQQ